MVKTPGKLSSVILWSVISAAFIGPGTVTTAVSAGSLFQIQLLWTIVFATLACIVLQEVSARIVIASGVTLGQAIDIKFSTHGFSVKLLAAVPVLLGCAAYEAGNILGGVSGLTILYDGDGRVYTILLAVAAAFILWQGGSRWISLLMTLLVAMMGIAFLLLALRTDFSFVELIRASTMPVIPVGSEWIVLGLVGTTIVPYNIFIGSAISKGQTVSLMRIGLAISVIIGASITSFILLGGTLVQQFSSFTELSGEFQKQVGATGAFALGMGLFAAGFSSAITAPYASSLIATTVLGIKKESHVRLVWGTVLLTGFIFGISGVRPIPVILAVQALNGLILPLLAYFLIVVVNDRAVVPAKYHPSFLYTGVLLAILFVTSLIGLNNVDKAVSRGFSLASENHFVPVVIVTSLIVLTAALQVWGIRRRVQA